VRANLEKNEIVGNIQILLDPETAKTDITRTELTGDDPATVTLGHEFGHAEAAIEDTEKFIKESADVSAYEKQGERYEFKILKELQQTQKEKDDNK